MLLNYVPYLSLIVKQLIRKRKYLFYLDVVARILYTNKKKYSDEADQSI